MSDPVLSIKDLHVMRGGVLVLRDINLSVETGEVVALIGPNGAGKSTLFGSIMGLHCITGGGIEFSGKPIHTMKTAAISKRISLAPQEEATFPFLTVLENLWVAKGSSRQDLKKDNLFKLFPVLYERRNQLACTLSGGQRQMLALGISLARKTELLLLDEPALGLAPIMVNRILHTVKEISETYKLSILVSEQNPRVLDIANRVYVIEGGQIRMEGGAKELITDERVTKVYLGMAV